MGYKSLLENEYERYKELPNKNDNGKISELTAIIEAFIKQEKKHLDKIRQLTMGYKPGPKSNIKPVDTRKFDPDDIEIKVGKTTMDWKNETFTQAMIRELNRLHTENITKSKFSFQED